jgi:hypothetical protein
MQTDIKEHIEGWIKHLSIKQVLIGGLPICPFAQKATYEIVETDGTDINPPNTDFELIIYKLPDELQQEDFFKLAENCNKKFKKLLFLPDYKDRKTSITGVQTNNGKYNLLMCQPRDSINLAREKLRKTNYYSYWDQTYFEEILKV